MQSLYCRLYADEFYYGPHNGKMDMAAGVSQLQEHYLARKLRLRRLVAARAVSIPRHIGQSLAMKLR